MSRTLSRTSLFLFSLTLALGAAEGTARLARSRADAALFDRAHLDADRAPPRGPVDLGDLIRVSDLPDLIFELRPRLEGVVYAGAAVTTNADGFRGRSQTPEEQPNRYCILGLGDSVMFGQGVAEDRAYLARLEENLLRDDPSRDWQVLNTAVPGYNSAQELAFLRSRGLGFRPDLIVIGFVSNDVNLPSFLHQRTDVWSLDRSFLLDWIRGRSVAHSTSLLTPAPTQTERLFRVEEDPEKIDPRWRHLVGWEAVERSLDELKALSREHDFEVLLFSHRASEHSARALDAARARGFYTCDLAPRLENYMRTHDIQRYRGSELTVSEVDPHPSAIHHRIAADGLQRALERIGIAQKP